MEVLEDQVMQMGLQLLQMRGQQHLSPDTPAEKSPEPRQLTRKPEPAPAPARGVSPEPAAAVVSDTECGRLKEAVKGAAAALKNHTESLLGIVESALKGGESMVSVVMV